jgi:hypothetical protein
MAVDAFEIAERKSLASGDFLLRNRRAPST